MVDPVIRVENLCKSYRLYAQNSERIKDVLFPWKQRHTLFKALHEVSFAVKQGEHLGIIGVNGAGKSTLLQILAGVLNPTSGSITVNGRSAALLELGAGFNPELTGRDNIKFLASILGVAREQTESFFADIIQFAELGEFIDQPVKLYSTGMFARLAFSMNIASLPDILIVDEALAVGDAFFQQKCLRRMKEYSERGTILFVSHDVGSVMNLCKHALWLDRGQVREYGPSKEVCEHYLASAYETTFASPENIRLAAAAAGADGAPEPEQASNQVRETVLSQMTRLKENPVSDFAGKESFGDGDASLLRCTLENLSRNTAHFEPHDLCRLSMYFYCKVDIPSLIAGFHFKDRLGQAIFGSNSFRWGKRWACQKDHIYAAVLEFNLPDLATGEYLITLSVADGTLSAHRQLHWVHDAAALQFISATNDGTMVAAQLNQCLLVGPPETA